MIEANEHERSFKGYALFFLIWALIPAGLGFLVVRLFDQLSKHDLLTILLLCILALIVVVGGGVVMAMKGTRR